MKNLGTYIGEMTQIDTPVFQVAELIRSQVQAGFLSVFKKKEIEKWFCPECGESCSHEEMEIELKRDVADIDLIICRCENVMKPKYKAG